MGERGPRPQRPDGLHVTRKGYLRGKYGGRQRLEHDVVWERHNGPIPDGYQIHHLNGDKQDNRIANLLAVTPTDHKRIHSGCELREGVWFKPCSLCHDFKPIDVAHWYISKEGWPLYGRCRPCHIAKVVRDKQLRKLRQAS